MSDLVFFSFDPYMFNRNTVRVSEPGNMYPGDLDRFVTAIRPILQSLVVQLSTYSVNNANSQASVIRTVCSCLKDSGLEIVATVRPLLNNYPASSFDKQFEVFDSEGSGGDVLEERQVDGGLHT
jgi:hypothetical protein